MSGKQDGLHTGQEDQRFELGRGIYNTRCYFCHGYAGDAKTLASTYLSPPPRDFTTQRADVLDRERMIASVRDGRPGSAMMSFSSLLDEQQISAVVDFVREAFMSGRDRNTLYHTAENGWENHQRYRLAFPFVLGEIPFDRAWEELTAEQQQGKRLFVSACISCHDRPLVNEEGPYWEPRAVSYPRGGYLPGTSSDEPLMQTDSVTGATPYAQHDIPPLLTDLTDQEHQGETIFQQNCAFCHAADGTGKNWIGSFLQNHPRNLTDDTEMHGMTRQRLRQVINHGLPDTTMPAWKSVLSEQEVDALIAYIAKAFFPLDKQLP